VTKPLLSQKKAVENKEEEWQAWRGEGEEERFDTGNCRDDSLLMFLM